mmetsp:Transcript_31219/g.62964  ORF Transcript_31219/g.62964 Transcript_31219/m.62964 type:complete len:135 (-) Transcript_31219:100-504(-)
MGLKECPLLRMQQPHISPRLPRSLVGDQSTKKQQASTTCIRTLKAWSETHLTARAYIPDLLNCDHMLLRVLFLALRHLEDSNNRSRMEQMEQAAPVEEREQVHEGEGRTGRQRPRKRKLTIMRSSECHKMRLTT